MNLGDAAHEYAEKGWPVFPLHGKDPLRGSHGFYDATTDPDQIRQWWKQNPQRNIGTSIPESMVVVDVDAKTQGLETLQDLEVTLGVPETLSVLTGGGGLHLYLLHPGGQLRQGTSIIGPGIDTRIPGKGYAVLPPSTHPSGRDYEWYDQTIPPAPMPLWMTERLRPVKIKVRRPSKLSRKPADAPRLASLIKTITEAPKGQRNDALYWASCRAAEIGGISRDTITDHLTAAAAQTGLETKAITATIRSGFAMGDRS